VPLIDTNVLFDLITNDPIWSLRQIESQALQDRLVVNPVVYAELSVSFDRTEKVDAFLGGAGITRDVRRYRSYFPTIMLITPGDA
jgi:predicted nucleic acid-binding protein